MIRSLLYSFLILIFFAFLLLSGLLGPQEGRKVFMKISDFFNWRPPKVSSLVDGTQESIKRFNESYKKVHILREMTLERSQQTFKDLELIYGQTRASLKELLFEMGRLTVSERAELFNVFTRLHNERSALVEAIIRDQMIMINLNDQMESELQSVSQWLNQKAQESSTPSTLDVMKMRQYESLRAQLKIFNEQTSGLDSMRILFLKKSKDSVDRLAHTNKELEVHFRELLAQVELSTSAQSPELWDQYQRLETEQRELVANLRSNEEYISTNQSEVINGILVISKTVEYSSDTQMERFRDNFAQMEERRRELLKNVSRHQQLFLSTRPSMQRMMDDNRYRMETMREKARQISDQYERMEEYRRSTTAMLSTMASELKDKNQFASQQVEDVMERSRDHIQQFVSQMDSAQTRINDFIKHGSQTVLSDSPSMHRLKDMQEKNRALLQDIKTNEQHLRALSDQVKRDQAALSQIRAETRRTNAQIMDDVKQRTEDQQRIMSEKIDDQLRRLKDHRLNQK